MELAPGTHVLDRFEVLQHLHGTRMADIYRARQLTGTRDEVLLKVLRLGCTERQAGRFEREARMMSMVSHPNVVQLLAYGFVDGNRPTIAMELIRGERLDRLLARVKVLPWQRSCQYMIPILSGLETIHAAGVVHRNLTPGNVCITKGDKPKLVNLELATLSSGYHEKLTWTGEVLGIPHYIAPERAFQQPVDSRTDVYGAAVTLYRMVSGQLPFRANTISDLLDAFRNPAIGPVAPSGMPPLPSSLQEALLDALEVDPEKRTASARLFARALRAAMRPSSSARLRAATPGPTVTFRSREERCVIVGVSRPPGPPVRELTEWLSHQLGARGTVYAIGDLMFVALLDAPDQNYAERVAATVKGAVAKRFGDPVKLAWTVTSAATVPDQAFQSGGQLPSIVQNIFRMLR